MTIQDLGAIGEFIGSIAVVISLLYLASQFRTQNKEARAAAMHEIWVAFREAISSLGDPQVADVYTRALSGDSLTDTEQLQLIVALQRILRVWEEAFLQMRKGRLDDDVWDTIKAQYVSVISNAAFRMVWELRGEVYNRDFRDFVDALPKTEGYRIRIVDEGAPVDPVGGSIDV